MMPRLCGTRCADRRRGLADCTTTPPTSEEPASADGSGGLQQRRPQVDVATIQLRHFRERLQVLKRAKGMRASPMVNLPCQCIGCAHRMSILHCLGGPSTLAVRMLTNKMPDKTSRLDMQRIYTTTRPWHLNLTLRAFAISHAHNYTDMHGSAQTKGVK